MIYQCTLLDYQRINMFSLTPELFQVASLARYILQGARWDPTKDLYM